MPSHIQRSLYSRKSGPAFLCTQLFVDSKGKDSHEKIANGPKIAHAIPHCRPGPMKVQVVLLIACLVGWAFGGTVQFSGASSSVALIDAGTTISSFTVTGPFDGMGIRVAPGNDLKAELFVQRETTPATLLKLTLSRSYPFVVEGATTLFGPATTPAYNGARLCSGTLLANNSFEGAGSSEAMWFGGEEDSDPNNRALAFLLDGSAFYHIAGVGRRRVSG